MGGCVAPFSSPYNADLSLTHPPYALFCAAQTSLLLPPAHPLRRTTPYIRCPSASLDYVMEGWFLGPGATGPGGPEFALWSKKSMSKYGTFFVSSVSDLPEPSQPRIALISGRTADNPRLLTECISAGCKAVYLEKPVAPTVLELQKMRDKVESVGIAVLMGSTKTCASTCTRLASLRRPCWGFHIEQRVRVSFLSLFLSPLSSLFFVFPFSPLFALVCVSFIRGCSSYYLSSHAPK
jgi:hypothetical protein